MMPFEQSEFQTTRDSVKLTLTTNNRRKPTKSLSVHGASAVEPTYLSLKIGRMIKDEVQYVRR
jgi:hypothetical protein